MPVMEQSIGGCCVVFFRGKEGRNSVRLIGRVYSRQTTRRVQARAQMEETRTIRERGRSWCFGREIVLRKEERE